MIVLDLALQGIRDLAGSTRVRLQSGYNALVTPRVEPDTIVAGLRELFARPISQGEKSIRPGDAIDVDFTSETLSFRGRKYRFSALGRVPQALIAAGGLENQGPLIKDAVIFKFNLPAGLGLDPSQQISNVGFLYGTSSDEGYIVPEPGTIVLMLLGTSGFLAFYRRKKS